MNQVRYVADTDFVPSSVRLRCQMALFILFGCACLASATPQQRANHSIVIVLSVVDDKSQAVPQAQIEIHAHGQLLATLLTDAAGKATATLQQWPGLVMTVSKQGYLATSTVLEIKANTGSTEVEVVLAKAELNQQSVEVHETASNPVVEESSSQATLAPAQAQETPGRPATLADTLPLVPGVVRASDGLLWGMYSLPKKFRPMPKIEDRSGFPYQRTSLLQQYITSIPGAQPRFPRYFSFDLRASKDIQVSRASTLLSLLPFVYRSLCP